MESPRAPRAIAVLIVALMLLHAVAYPFATVLLDSSRDLSQAWAIVQGEPLLLGPRIDDRFHLGPVWFWLLAAPLAASKSAAFTLLCVGLLASLKFPLAYACGKRMLDARFGVFWAVALALPGWNSLQPMFPTHTNLVEALMLAALLPLIRLWQREEAHGWCAYGLLQGLAFHAHPATVLLLPLAAAVAWQRRAMLRGDAASMAGGAALAVLPFAPMLWHEASHGWPMLGTLFARGVGGGILGVLELARGVFVQGPGSAFAPGGAKWVSLAAIVFPLLALTLVPGWATALAQRRGLGRVLLAALLAFVLLAAMRARTPFYMVYAWLPFGAAVLAVAWWSLWQVPRARSIASVAVGLCLASAAAATALQLRDAHAGQSTLLAGSVADVRKVSAPRRVPLLPAWLLDRWGRDVCEANRPTVVHGDLALLVDAALAISVRLACDRTDLVGIGGGANLPDAVHLAGLTPGQRRILGEVHAGWPQAFSQGPVRVVASGQTTPVATGGLLELRPRSIGALVAREIEFMAPRHSVIAVGLPFAVYDEARVENVDAAGFAREPIFTGAATRLYRCDECTSVAVTWRIVVRTREPERLDILVLTPVAATSPD